MAAAVGDRNGEADAEDGATTQDSQVEFCRIRRRVDGALCQPKTTMMPGSGSPALASGSPAARAQLTGLTSGVAFNNQLALAPVVAPPTSLASCSVKAKAVAAGEVDSGRSG